MRMLSKKSQPARRRLPTWAIIAGGLAAATVAGSILPASAFPGSRAPAAVADSPERTGVTNAGFRHHFWRNHPYNSRMMNNRSGWGPAAAVGAGVAGFAASTVLAPTWGDVDDYHAYCASRFRSYDPATGTYLGYDGAYYPCT